MRKEGPREERNLPEATQQGSGFLGWIPGAPTTSTLSSFGAAVAVLGDSLLCVPAIPVFVPFNLTDIDSGPAGSSTRQVLEKNSPAFLLSELKDQEERSE